MSSCMYMHMYTYMCTHIHTYVYMYVYTHACVRGPCYSYLCDCYGY